MILKSAHPYVSIPELPLAEYVLGRLEKYGRKVAIVHDDTGDRITYDELVTQTKKCAAALYKHGLRRGDIVAIVSQNRFEFVVVVLAVAACGATVTACNPLYTKEEIARQLQSLSLKIIFTEPNLSQMLKSLSEQLAGSQKIYTFGKCKLCQSYADLVEPAQVEGFPSNVRVDIRDDTIFMPYSSGTTGVPKGVMLTSYGLVSYFELFMLHFRLGPNERAFCPLPIFHSAGFTFTFSSLCCGCCVVINYRFDIEKLLAAISLHKITITITVPTMLSALANRPSPERHDISSLRNIFTGASSLPMTVAKKVESRFSAKIYPSYGLTEALPLTVAQSPECPRNSVGRLCANSQIKVIDGQGKILGVNEVGEICAKGPQMMKGYYQNPVATTATIDSHGWIHTGDLGKFDRNGFVYIEGRIKELIKNKSNQVSPTELEMILMEHPKISDAAVVGIPHPEAGEIPRAFIVRNHASLTADHVHSFLKGKVSKFKYLSGGVLFVPMIPRSVTGKILRKELPVGGYPSL